MVWKITIIDNRGIDKNSLFRRSAEIALELLDDRRLLRRLLALGPDKHQPEDHADEEQLLIRIRFFDAPRKVYTAPGQRCLSSFTGKLSLQCGSGSGRPSSAERG